MSESRCAVTFSLDVRNQHFSGSRIAESVTGIDSPSVVKLRSHFKTPRGVQQKRGTGWFVGLDVVVTAGHLVYDRGQDNWGQCISVEICMDDQGDQSVDASNSDVQVRYGRWVVTAESWARPHLNEAQALRHDIAFIRFQEPFHGQTNILNYASVPASTRNLFIPYPGEKQDGGMYRQRAPTTWDVDADEDHMITHQISTHGDQSGAPIIAETEEGRLVVGTHCYDTGEGGSKYGTSIGGRWGIEYAKYLALFNRTDAFDPIPRRLRIIPLDLPPPANDATIRCDGHQCISTLRRDHEV